MFGPPVILNQIKFIGILAEPKEWKRLWKGNRRTCSDLVWSIVRRLIWALWAESERTADGRERSRRSTCTATSAGSDWLTANF